jgi:predicted PurR-regulated permease PerM
MLIGAAIIVGLVLYLGRDALGPFILGLFLVYLLDPAVTRLERRLRVPRWLGVFFLYAVIVLVFVLVVRLTLPPLVEQLSRLIAQLPALMTTWIAGLEQAIRDLDILPASVRDELIRSLEELSDSLTEGLAGSGLAELLESLVLTMVGPVARIVTSFFAYLVIPIFVFYLAKDRPALVAAIHRAMPDAWEPDVRAVTTIVDRVFGRWLRGQLILGVATFVGLEVLAIVIDPVFGDFAVLLAILAGVLELVPIIGPIISAIPMILIGATVGIEGAVAAFLLSLAIQQVENNVLVPQIQGGATDLHPAIVIAGIVIGGSIGGILGAILALPLSAAFRDVIRYLFRRLDPVPMPVDAALVEALRPAAWRLPRSDPDARSEGPAASESPPASDRAPTGDGPPGDR